MGLLGLFTMTTGCASTGMARTLDEGELQMSLTPGKHYSLEGSGSKPQMEVGLRYGATDRVDVGVRLFPFGLTMDTRIALAKSPTLDSGVDVTLAPSATMGLYGSGGYFSFPSVRTALEMPVLVGLNLGRGTQFVVGPRVAYVPPKSDEEGRVLMGTSVGLALPLMTNVRVVPEVTVRKLLDGRQTLLNANIGVLFGGYSGGGS